MTNKIQLKYVTEEGITMLKGSFLDDIDHYKNNDHKYFLDKLNRGTYLKDSAYSVSDFTKELKYDEDEDICDAYNVKVLHEALKDIPTYILMDERFWVGLNFTIMWDYIYKRRKTDVFDKKDTVKEETIYNCFFTHTRHGLKRGTYVNCVSRLFWAGELAYDSSNSNHYELVEQICQTGFPSTILLLSSSNILCRKDTMTGFLKATKDVRAAGTNINRNKLVKVVRELNLIAGISILDLYPKDKIIGIAKEIYNSV